MFQIIGKKWRSPNYNERRGGAAVKYIILHYTGMKTAEEALERLCDPSSEVSSHYAIEENGKIHTLVPENKRAWHAGLSYWEGETDLNSASIGIELVNPGHEFGYRPFPDRQIAALIKLCRKIMAQHTLGRDCILGHSDIAPARKIDPGHFFPWQILAAAGIGRWPKPKEIGYQAAEDLIHHPPSIHQLLNGFGYDPQLEDAEVIRAFMRRFHPEKFSTCEDTPEPDIETLARLLALAGQAHALKT